MTAFFTPTDLRAVDPRPAASPSEAEEETVRELLSVRLAGDDLTTALQALGLAAYKAPPAAPKPAHPKRDTARAVACPQGHDRKQHSTADRSGRMYCLICKRADGERRRARAAARRSAAA